jgi:hypothetical protein
MKQVYTTKDAYQDNSVRVNYFHKDAVRTHKQPEWNEETKRVELKEIEEIYDELLFCERLFWETNETELDVNIENTRQIWEERINA